MLNTTFIDFGLMVLVKKPDLGLFDLALIIYLGA
jgi:hypothetical protein